MRNICALAPAVVLVLWACGGQPPAEYDTTTIQKVSPESQAAGPALTSFDTPATVAPEVAEAWTGVRVQITDRDGGAHESFDIPLGGAELLGESGLVLSAGVFLPDFILDESGISSRSSEPFNPAVRVVISEDGMEDFEGWLFAKMPEIHPYPHARYQVLLVEGIPAE